MIQCTEDICSLILSPEYTMKYDPWDNKPIKNYVLTAGGNFNTRLEVGFDRNFVEIYAFEDKNSKYYERLYLNTFAERFKADKLKELLKAKHLAAMVTDIDEKYR